MATTTATLTHCPTCGVKLERPELSLCAYCASPLRVGPVEVPNDETQKRLAKVKVHADFAAAMTWAPSDPHFERRAHGHSVRAAWALSLALLLGLWVAWTFYAGAGVMPVVIAVPATLAALGFLSLILAGAARSEHRRAPMLKRAAYVLDRRSETNEKGGVGSTTYIFKIRFEDGSEGEFRHTGRGSMYEPPANGAAGVAYTRGPRMLDFRRI
ncbi:MAG: hypothetical protein IPK67_02855 [Planctomycetes bacterium]|nr:hypothetical protein [Planctomycetota bacterium]